MPYRSFLFVPGHKSELFDKAIRSGADAIIMDLEDSVPVICKSEARGITAAALTRLGSANVHRFVRINAWASGLLLDDCAAVVSPGLDGIVLSKVMGPHEIQAMDLVVTELEISKGLAVGRIELFPIAETAEAMYQVHALCAASPRVKRTGPVTHSSPSGGDFYSALGAEWTKDGREAHYVASKTVLEARAAGVRSLLCGPSTDIADLEQLSEVMVRGRILGATGALCIHPSHVPIVNKVFSPRLEDVADAVEILRVMQTALAGGDAAAVFKGRMVDFAHACRSAQLVELALNAGTPVQMDADIRAFASSLAKGRGEAPRV